MKNLKKIFGWIVPVALVLVLALGLFLPFSLNGEGSRTQLKTIRADESGASTADKSQKGGSIYLEEGGTTTMSGGTIENSKNTYGGAIYVSNKAIFTMNGGTIQNCQAKYGGAIYIASGGKVIINGGKILKNKAEVAPAIYVEQGGSLTITGTSEVDGNIVGDWQPYEYEMGSEEMMGGTYIPYGSSDGITSTIKLKTIYIGSYPQTYVGNTLNSQLESWWTEDKPVVQTYTIRDQIWKSYQYTDGSIYARGNSRLWSSSGVTYKDGTTAKATGATAWFKVEPIKWYIMNYDAWKAKTEKMELFSELILAGRIQFNASTDDGNNWAGSKLQEWLNGDFYETAFTSAEQADIAKTENKNNITNQHNNDPSTWTGTTTQDNVYCKTYYEMCHDMFSDSSSAGNGYAARMCSPTDFAISNGCALSTRYTTEYRTGTCNWWLRSAGSASTYVCLVSYNGYLGYTGNVSFDYIVVRPALHLNV